MMKRVLVMLLLVSAVVVSLSLLSTEDPSAPLTATMETAANVRKSCQRTRLDIQLLPAEQKGSKSDDALSTLLNSLAPSASAQGCFPDLNNEIDCECPCMQKEREVELNCQARGEYGSTPYTSCECQGTRAYDDCMTRTFCYKKGERAMLRQAEPECFTVQ